MRRPRVTASYVWDTYPWIEATVDGYRVRWEWADDYTKRGRTYRSLRRALNRYDKLVAEGVARSGALLEHRQALAESRYHS